jgi:metal-responsive CopG/Arc/MetJ family transcriptional regulator
MSKSLSLHLEEEVLREVDEAAQELHLARETFVQQAVRSYVRQISHRRLRSRLRKESALTAAESMRVLKEFEAIS